MVNKCSVHVCHPSSPSVDVIHGWYFSIHGLYFSIHGWHPQMTLFHPWMAFKDGLLPTILLWLEIRLVLSITERAFALVWMYSFCNVPTSSVLIYIYRYQMVWWQLSRNVFRQFLTYFHGYPMVRWQLSGWFGWNCRSPLSR